MEIKEELLYKYPVNYQFKTADDINKGDVLLGILYNPINECSVKYFDLKNMYISEIKQMLQLNNSKGIPVLCDYVDKVSEKSIPKILFALKMYDDQVIRQANTILMDNKFIGDRKQKMDLVTIYYNDIANYFLDEVCEETIWGKFSSAQRQLFFETINTPNLTYPLKRRNNLINAIALYITLDEAKAMSHGNYLSLNRFIIK